MDKGNIDFVLETPRTPTEALRSLLYAISLSYPLIKLEDERINSFLLFIKPYLKGDDIPQTLWIPEILYDTANGYREHEGCVYFFVKTLRAFSVTVINAEQCNTTIFQNCDKEILQWCHIIQKQEDGWISGREYLNFFRVEGITPTTFVFQGDEEGERIAFFNDLFVSFSKTQIPLTVRRVPETSLSNGFTIAEF